MEKEKKKREDSVQNSRCESSVSSYDRLLFAPFFLSPPPPPFLACFHVPHTLLAFRDRVRDSSLLLSSFSSARIALTKWIRRKEAHNCHCYRGVPSTEGSRRIEREEEGARSISNPPPKDNYPLSRREGENSCVVVFRPFEIAFSCRGTRGYLPRAII